MSIWSEIKGYVTLHEKDHISMRKLFEKHTEIYDCVFTYTKPHVKRNDKINYYFCVVIDCNIFELNNILEEIDVEITGLSPKYFSCDWNIQTRLIV